ncbi:MAG: hypothetical protein GY759_22410 [Chloroflexi bacterium]|nr:hypothetical protein [Chloroflexota bacterium]
MTLPETNEQSDLPPGVHQATLQEISERFGGKTTRRHLLMLRLERIYKLVVETGHLARFIVFGSFTTAKAEPNDVDIFLLMEDSFNFDQTSGETRLLFDHRTAQDYFGCSVFWIRRLAAFDGEQATIEHWQIKRDGKLRGIIEIVLEVS